MVRRALTKAKDQVRKQKESVPARESRKQFRLNEMKSGCCPSRRSSWERVEQNARK